MEKYKIHPIIKALNKKIREDAEKHIERNPASFADKKHLSSFIKKTNEEMFYEFVEHLELDKKKETKAAYYSVRLGFIAKSISVEIDGKLAAVKKWRYENGDTGIEKCKQIENRKIEQENAKKKATPPVEIPAAPVVPVPEFELSAPIAEPAPATPAKKSLAQNPAERAQIAAASYAAAEYFELGGDPLDNLTGQTALLF